MKTKYVKVSVEERLPSSESIYPVVFGLAGETIIETVNYNEFFGFHAENVDCSLIEYWLDEVPDREVEMLEMLNEMFNSNYVTIRNDDLKEQIKNLIKEATTLK